MTKWTLAIALLALGAVACGDDDNDNDDKNDAGGNGNGNSNGDGGFIPDGGDCTRELVKKELGNIGAEWTMTPPWSQAQAQACFAKCPGGETSCFSEMCENGDLFLECYTGEIGYCGADVEDAACPDEHQVFGCCLVANCADATTQDAFDACLQANCLESLQEFFTCADTACGEPAFVKCASGTDPGGGDAGSRKIGSIDKARAKTLMNKAWLRTQALKGAR